MIHDLLADPTFVPHRGTYLDFACGTGRITRKLGPYFESAVGLDISAAMLERARAQTTGINFVEANIAIQPDVVSGPFDLVSSFRFLLNAETADRALALRWIRERLRDGASRVLINNHGNLWSHKALSHSWRLAQGQAGRRVSGNVLAHREAMALFRETGFVVDRRLGLGVVPGRGIDRIGYDRMLRWERRLWPLSRMGVDQIYVLRRMS